LAVVAISGLTTSAFADNDATARIAKVAGKSKAKRIAKTVSKRMSKSATVTNKPNDPIRVRTSLAVAGAPVPSDKKTEAKVRLYLYAGLNDWALDELFKPEKGAIKACQRDFKLSAVDCKALVAASGDMSMNEAADAGGGAAPPLPTAGVAQRSTGGYAAARPRYQARPAYRAAPAPSGRFKKYDSGFRGGGGAAPSYAAQPRYQARPAAQPRARPMARPAPQRRAAPQPKPDYKAQRQAYLDRLKKRMEARKAKVVAAAQGGAAPAAAPAATPKASASKKPDAAAAPKASAAEAAPAAAAAEEPAAPPKPKGPSKGMDSDFLNGLLDDPLG
jgi:hypothetical protein